MTFEEMEKSVKDLQDNQTVQGHRLGRTEANLDRLEADLHHLEGMVERNAEAVEKIAEGSIVLQAAVQGLTATVDRFIRGMEHNGHRPQDNGPEEVR